ncbi:DUF1460 domain-containing protein [Serratia sp. UGAL515B_01]|uniref:DUF1460 domain-containing protein n=1 Tax=Serratia sp. UGAL515B_01 TaxID=2986763 RepID=UPI0029552406|nr:DUF1460 domain-containing protein [Serratia sp. UGAL515B_01]WON78020.1 DUF1460 domain-containing protein [Serratia sp. UGAL515B_01]
MYRLALTMLVTAVAGCSSNKHTTSNPIESKPHKIEYQAMVRMTMDDYTINKLRALLTLHAAVPELDKGQTIDLLSQAFLDTPYIANRLIGSSISQERLVIDLGALDCFTYMDYVEALRKAPRESEFITNVIQTRYVNSEIDFQHRKHFFTDWAQKKHVIADDITAQISPHAVTVVKHLNRKAGGDVYLPGIPVVERNVTYIPSEFIDEKTLSQLQTGDYIGIYTQLSGLDVTHTGFFIMTANGPVLRHASSHKENMKVMDSGFVNYVRNTPGIVVLRPR